MTSKNYEHQGQKRSNIPTQEGEKYMNDKDREAIPYEPDVRYAEAPRLAWIREKPDQVRREAGPLYIHEKVEPSAFLNQLKEEEKLLIYSMFDDDLPEHAKYEWYQHKGNWSNRIIHGDSAQIMTSLATREQMEGQVQMVYFDPPYGISFKSTMQVDTRKNENPDKVEGISPEPEMCATFRDTYKRGIHDYLDTIRENSILARSLLAESGSFFLQIGRENMPRICVLLDEIFGAENRIAIIPFQTAMSSSAKFLPQVCGYLLWFAKDRSFLKFFQLYQPAKTLNKGDFMVENADGTSRHPTVEELQIPGQNLPGTRNFKKMTLTSPGTSTTGRSEPFEWQGRLFPCPVGYHWQVSIRGMQQLGLKNRLISGENSLWWKRYEDENPGTKMHNLWNQQMNPSDKHYVVETSTKVIERAVLMTTSPGDLVLDITCGSGTTAIVAENWGRRWITTDASRVPIALTRQRILSGVHKWLVLLNSDEGKLLVSGYTNNKYLGKGDPAAVDPSAGFVYRRIPYVSAKTLAYNETPSSTLLIDQPHVTKNKIKRISSPFTVESLSPYRTVSPEEYLVKNHQIESHTNIIDALEISGIKTTDAGRLHLHNIELLDSEGGILTHQAEIDFKTHGEISGTTPCAISLLPDDATASQSWIVAAANRAAALRDYEELVVIAFNFESDALVDTPQKRGRLGIRCCRANRDLMIGSLDNNRTDEAFIQIGEPDILIEEVENGQITVQIQGYDTFDPVKGNLKKGGENEIDCWMIDTNYDQTGFNARRIHFPGKLSDKQLTRYKRELGQEISNEKWNAMLSTKSAPFPKPLTGYIAVRIITNTSVEMTTVKNVLRSLEFCAAPPPH